MVVIYKISSIFGSESYRKNSSFFYGIFALPPNLPLPPANHWWEPCYANRGRCVRGCLIIPVTLGLSIVLQPGTQRPPSPQRLPSPQLPVQFHGQLLLADSARSKRLENRFKESHVKIWMNYRFHLRVIGGGDVLLSCFFFPNSQSMIFISCPLSLPCCRTGTVKDRPLPD